MWSFIVKQGCPMDYYCTLEFTSCVGLMLTNMLYVWSSAKQIAMLYVAAVWDGKTCGQAASTSRLDDAKWKITFYPIIEKVG
jgi:hypothetical protein